MRHLSTITALAMLFFLVAGCHSTTRETATKNAWENYKDEAWAWTSKHSTARLTKSHSTMSFHDTLSITTSPEGEGVLRYYFAMMGKNLNGIQHYPFEDNDILVEFNMPQNQWRLVWPNAEWKAHAATAQGEAWGLGGLSRSFYGGTPWFDPDSSLIYDKQKLVALRYHMAFAFGSSQKADALYKVRNATHIVKYDLGRKTWRLLYPKPRQ